MFLLIFLGVFSLEFPITGVPIRVRASGLWWELQLLFADRTADPCWGSGHQRPPPPREREQLLSVGSELGAPHAPPARHTGSSPRSVPSVLSCPLPAFPFFIPHFSSALWPWSDTSFTPPLLRSPNRAKSGENFFTAKVVGHRDRLPREVVASPALGVFNRRVDVALGTRFSGGFTSVGFTAGLGDLKGFFQPELF